MKDKNVNAVWVNNSSTLNNQRHKKINCVLNQYTLLRIITILLEDVKDGLNLLENVKLLQGLILNRNLY